MVVASVHADKAEVRWFKRVRQHEATFEELADVVEERFRALGTLLCHYMIHVLPADLNQRIRRKEDEAW